MRETFKNFILGLKEKSFFKMLENIFLMLKTNYKKIAIILFFAIIPGRILFGLGETDFLVRISVLILCIILLAIEGNWIIPKILDSYPFQLVLFIGLYLEELLLSSFLFGACISFSIGCILPIELEDALFPYVCICLVCLTYERFIEMLFDFIGDPQIYTPKSKDDLTWETVSLMLSALSTKYFGVRVQNRVEGVSKFSYPFITKRYISDDFLKEGIKKLPRKHVTSILVVGLAGWGIGQYKDYKLKSETIQSNERIRLAEIKANAEKASKDFELSMAQVKANGKQDVKESVGVFRNWWPSSTKNVKAPSMEKTEFFQVIENCFSKLKDILCFF